MRRLESSMVLLMIGIAIVLAIGAFLAGSILFDRRAETAVEATLPQAQPDYTVMVENELITLSVDPNMRPIIVAEAPAPELQPEPVEESAEPAMLPEMQPAAPVEAPAAQVQGAIGGLPVDHVMFISYQVQPDDTLFRIQANQVTSIALMAKHGIDATDIVPGNILNLPVGNPAACGDWRPYVVLQGDTVFGLCKQFNTTLADLQVRNNLDANYSLYETQVICVP